MNTIMSLYTLPQVLLNEIYSYDDTYKNIFVTEILSEFKEVSLNKWKKLIIASLEPKLATRLDFVFEYLFDIWSPHFRNGNVQEIIILISLAYDDDICDQNERLFVTITLNEHTLNGFVYNKKDYFDNYVHGYDAISFNTFTELVHDNNSLYFVQSI